MSGLWEERQERTRRDGELFAERKADERLGKIERDERATHRSSGDHHLGSTERGSGSRVISPESGRNGDDEGGVVVDVSTG